jgi:hypothetical protein
MSLRSAGKTLYPFAKIQGHSELCEIIRKYPVFKNDV